MGYLRSLRIAFLITLTWRVIQGQNCFGGIESFEKTTGSAFGASVGTSVLLQQQDQALTRDCINLCKQQSQCFAFSLDYAGFRCSAYNVNSVGRRDALETRLNNNFFEKTCFHGVQKTLFENLCGDRLWAFERVKDAFLNGYVEKEAQNVQTKEECERLCLTQITFICRSADYDEVMRVCRMSKEDRRSQPQAFREVPGSNRDYLENQCAASAPTSCRYDIRPGLSIISMDSLQFASSSDDCQVQCDSEKIFNCRAFTYSSNRCFLSGDDSVSLGPVVLPEKPGATYGEKKCVIEQCTGGAFTYEKMTGFVLRSAVQTSILVSNPGSLGSTLECQEFCQRDGLDCPAFSVNYQNMRCDKLDRNSQGRTQDLVPRDGENYYEKICLRGSVATACKDKAWAFERVLGHELEGHLYDRSAPFVQSRRDCEELCLEERSFVCRSALYNDDTTECKLSREDRRTLPAFYSRTNNMKVNYLENHCLPVLTSCPYEETPDSYPTYTDNIQMIGITSSDVCEQFCTNYRSFNCRSFAYYSSNGQCFVSGDDRASGGSGAVQARPGLVYNERKCPSVTTPTENPTPPITGSPPPTRQCSPGEVMMLEKATGYQHLGSISILYRGNPDIPGITSECRRMCELNYECRGFTLDYLKQECYSGTETSSTKPKDLIPVENKAYFEGICLPFYLGCSKQWMFERYVDKELRGVQARDVVRLVTRSDCERRCLEEKRFVCRSANYYKYNQECRLFGEERTTPHTQLAYASGVDYLENQCNIGTATCPYRLPERDMFMVYSTKAIPSISNYELCRQQCIRELDFNCRSYTYLEQGGLNNLCLLSGESRQTGQGKAIRYRLRSIFEETECRGQTPGTTPPTSGTPPTIPTPSVTIPTIPPPARCSFDQFTYEKVSSSDMRYGRRERVVTRNPLGVVTECQSNCQRLGDRCRGFVIEYSRYQQLCFWLDAFSSGVDNTISPAQDTAYFEKICLTGRTCGKLWTFERVPGYDFREIPDLEIPGVPRRTDCEDFCLRHQPTCRAATYDTLRRICRLYSETRRTRPNSFVREGAEMEYVENQCAVEPSTCDYRNVPDRFFSYIDRLSRAFSLADCQRQCDVERQFSCRSLNFETVTRDCALSSDDTVSVSPGQEALKPRPNSIYSEKGNCEQVTVQCNQQDMLLTVNFGSPFHGRVYAKGNPTQCYIIGAGQTTLQFAISLGARCGTVVEGSGRYANEVIIQQHPVIVTNSDKTIKVVCSFETLDRTVTLGAPFPGASPGMEVTTRYQVPVTALVTNTAPPPNVVMRVLDRTGRDAGVVGLGDDLMLRIELREQASSLGIFARNLYARSKNGESLFLIDSTGCPTDPNIFPALSLDARDRKSLFANFKAFRFPSTGLVNFEVQIRFCQDQCKTIRCSNNVESFGRRKRDLPGTEEHSFNNDSRENHWGPPDASSQHHHLHNEHPSVQDHFSPPPPPPPEEMPPMTVIREIINHRIHPSSIDYKSDGRVNNITSTVIATHNVSREGSPFRDASTLYGSSTTESSVAAASTSSLSFEALSGPIRIHNVWWKPHHSNIMHPNPSHQVQNYSSYGFLGGNNDHKKLTTGSFDGKPSSTIMNSPQSTYLHTNADRWRHQEEQKFPHMFQMDGDRWRHESHATVLSRNQSSGGSYDQGQRIVSDTVSYNTPVPRIMSSDQNKNENSFALNREISQPHNPPLNSQATPASRTGHSHINRVENSFMTGQGSGHSDSHRHFDSHRDSANRQSDGHKDSAHRQSDGHRDSAHRQSDGHRDSAHRQSDGHRDSAHIQSDGHRDSAHRQSDGHRDSAHRQSDGHRYSANRQFHRHKHSNSHRDPVNRNSDGHRDPVNRNSDGHRDPVNRNSDGHRDPVNRNSDGHRDPVNRNSDGHKDTENRNSDGHSDTRIRNSDGLRDPTNWNSDSHRDILNRNPDDHSDTGNRDFNGHRGPANRNSDDHRDDVNRQSTNGNPHFPSHMSQPQIVPEVKSTSKESTFRPDDRSSTYHARAVPLDDGKFSAPNQDASHHQNTQRRPPASDSLTSGQWMHENNRVQEQQSSTGDIPPSALTTPELVISTHVPIPDELPLSLAIMVGDDGGMEIKWDADTRDFDRSPDSPQLTSNVVCTSVTTIIATAVTLSLVHVGALIGAYCCYRWHRKNKRKKLFQESLALPRPDASGCSRDGFYAKPDVSFRNVYGSYESPP